MRVRKFNNEGVIEYQNWLIKMRDDGEQNLPNHLLEDDNFTIVLNEELEDRTFANTREFGEYVNSVINENFINDFGMWNWFSFTLK